MKKAPSPHTTRQKTHSSRSAHAAQGVTRVIDALLSGSKPEGVRPRASTNPANAEPAPSSSPEPSSSRPSNIRYSAKARAWAEHFVLNGLRDPELAARTAGIARPDRCRDYPHKYYDLVEETRLRLARTTTMNLGEALEGVAGLARTADDPKVQLAAYRTILEVQGALGRGEGGDQTIVVRELEKLAATINQRLQQQRLGARKEPKLVGEGRSGVVLEAELVPVPAPKKGEIGTFSGFVESENEAVDKGPAAG